MQSGVMTDRLYQRDSTLKSFDATVVAIRPEMLSLSRERGPEGGNAVQGIMKAAAYLGDRSHFYVHVDGTDKPFAVAAQEAQTSLSHSLDPGTVVWLAWPDEALIVLPRP